MGQWQPDGTDLLPPGRDAVENATRDDEVAARIVMTQGQAGTSEVDRSNGAGQQGDGGDRDQPGPRGQKRLSHHRRVYGSARSPDPATLNLY
jgi:hypothetical protein